MYRATEARSPRLYRFNSSWPDAAYMCDICIGLLRIDVRGCIGFNSSWPVVAYMCDICIGLLRLDIRGCIGFNSS